MQCLVIKAQNVLFFFILGKPHGRANRSARPGGVPPESHGSHSELAEAVQRGLPQIRAADLLLQLGHADRPVDHILRDRCYRLRHRLCGKDNPFIQSVFGPVLSLKH